MILVAFLSTMVLTQDVSAKDRVIDEAKALGKTLVKAQICYAAGGLQMGQPGAQNRIDTFLMRAEQAGLTPIEVKREIENATMFEMAALVSVSGVDLDRPDIRQAFADAGLADYDQQACEEAVAEEPDLFGPVVGAR